MARCSGTTVPDEVHIYEQKESFSPYTVHNVHPGFSVDCVILSFFKKKIQVLLNQFLPGGGWQLPGGFMCKEECADDAARRVLRERTGLTEVYLKQFHLFSDPRRTNLEENAAILKQSGHQGGFTGEEKQWYLQRFISLGYYSFVKYDTVILSEEEDHRTRWFDVENLPSLYSDHAHIIKASLERIRCMLPVTPVGYELLPEKFTISELRRIYEIVLGRSLDRRNFLRKAMASGVLIQLDEKKSSSPYNPPILYKFDEKALKKISDSYF